MKNFVVKIHDCSFNFYETKITKLYNLFYQIVIYPKQFLLYTISGIYNVLTDNLLISVT